MCKVSKFEDKVAEIHGYTENRSVNEKIMAETTTEKSFRNVHFLWQKF